MEKIRKFVKRGKSLFGFGIDESRIKKKLLLYFILISLVSITISMEVILEVSESRIQKKISQDFIAELKNHISIDPEFKIETINQDNAFHSLDDLKIRMILLFLVIIGTILTALMLFSRDIADPIDSLVEGAKKVADGDLTYTLPVFTDDEIGQLAKLINDMNANLQELVVEIRFEMNRMGKIVEKMQEDLQPAMEEDLTGKAAKTRSIKISEVRKMQDSTLMVFQGLQSLKEDLSALTMLIDMYKVYQVHTINQDQEV